jgi:ribosomal protein L11 methyltransferase
MPTFKAIATGAEATLEEAAMRLSEIMFPPADAVSLTKDDDSKEDAEANWRLEAYFAEECFEHDLRTALDGLDIRSLSIEQLPDIDWVAHSLQGLGVVRAGRFVLYGAHDADKANAEEDSIPIRIDANQAFGTGHHPTTAGCLQLLDRFAGAPPERIFDLGCGSAVLAIAAAKLWDRPVLASDIDAKSVEIARENVALNGVNETVTTILADGFSDQRIAAAAPFDFVFANILAGPLVEFAPAMAASVAPRGRVMLAGLMRNQEAAVEEAYVAAGFRRINRLDHETWPVLLFVKL